MYERFIEELKLYSRAIRVLSKGYVPISVLPPSKLEKILSEVRIAITKSNKDYDLVLTSLYLYYDIKLVTFGIDNQRNLIVQFPVFVQPYTQKRLVMYQIETVPVPILDENEQVHSYTELKIEKPYIAFNKETYITLHSQELKMCKRIGYKYYCEELFVIKSKTRYICASAIYFNLESDVIRANCEFQHYYNKTDIKPTVLDGGFQISHSITLNNFSIVGREEQNLSGLIKESMFIRVNNPSLNKNIGKYHLPHIWDEVLINNIELKLK